MRLFDFRKNKQPRKALTEFNRYDLELKAKNGKQMTADEYEALERFRTRDVWDQVFKVFGVVTILTIIMLAVFIFLYPYSLFNVFPTSAGRGDVFWKMLNNWHVYVGDSETWLGQRSVNGYVEMHSIYETAFQPEKGGMPSGFDFKCGVYVIGSWTIVIVATLGFLGAILGAAYILAANIKNLIGVIRHVTQRTGDTFQGIGVTAKESYEESLVDPAAKPTRKPRSSKKKEPKVVEEPKEELSDVEEKEVAARVAELKEELAQEEKAEQPKIVPVKEAPKAKDKYDSMSDKDIDKLLSGM